VCCTYLPNIYGTMRDALNQGLPSDRFEMAWHINSSHVVRHLQGTWAPLLLEDLQAAGVPVLNAPSPTDVPSALPADQSRLLVEIPTNFQQVKATDMSLAAAWRQQTRLLFEMSFAAGYTVIDTLFQEGRFFYVLQKDWRP
jgi:predicted GNAT superfamily acetyltransferase